jgi:hypothetical protein
LYSSLNIIRMIKSRKMRWARHWESQKEIDHYEDLDIRGMIMFKWILRNRMR